MCSAISSSGGVKGRFSFESTRANRLHLCRAEIAETNNNEYRHYLDRVFGRVKKPRVDRADTRTCQEVWVKGLRSRVPL